MLAFDRYSSTACISEAWTCTPFQGTHCLGGVLHPVSWTQLYCWSRTEKYFLADSQMMLTGNSPPWSICDSWTFVAHRWPLCPPWIILQLVYFFFFLFFLFLARADIGSFKIQNLTDGGLSYISSCKDLTSLNLTWWVTAGALFFRLKSLLC